MRKQCGVTGVGMQCRDGFAYNRQQQLWLHAKALADDLAGNFDRGGQQLVCDALIDFSSPAAVHRYGEAVRRRRLMLVSGISAYSDTDLAYVRSLGEDARVMSSPNITLGINFLILGARLLREIAPHADVAVIEEHFRDKPEVSGTARKIAESLDIKDDDIRSLRLGGIVGHHEVVFGFPYQTVRLVHDSIRREAFGTGAVFALRELAKRTGPGYYSFEDLLVQRLRSQLLAA